jgi:hypothetical protein
MGLDEEVAALKEQMAALNAKLSALGEAPPVDVARDQFARETPRRVEPRRVEISYLADRDDAKDLPSAESIYAQLFKRAGDAFPLLAKSIAKEPDPLGRFTSAFRWLATKGRSKEPNVKLSFSIWVDDARDWLRAHSIHPDLLRGPDLLLAVIASNDIPFTPGDSSIGQLWEIGIERYGGTPPIPGAWRQVLAGNLRKPTRSRYAA